MTKASKLKQTKTKKDPQSEGISYKIIGTILQALVVQLDQDKSIYSESGKMAWMSSNITLQTNSKGLQKSFSRLVASESLFINEFTAEKGTGIVSFSSDQAGKILPLKLTLDGPGILFQKGFYLCSEQGVDRSTVVLRKLKAGLFSGSGFMLQRLEGVGTAHLVTEGDVVMYNLKINETLLIDQGNLVAFEDSVSLDAKAVQGGLRNWIFSGEGVFLGSLTGPGKIWLQTRKQTIAQSVGLSTSAKFYSSNPKKRSVGAIISFIVSLLIILFVIFIAYIGNS